MIIVIFSAAMPHKRAKKINKIFDSKWIFYDRMVRGREKRSNKDD
jgi:hypothetical protein